MSGTTLPYHLRQNKAVDRYIFFELLKLVDRYRRLSEYKYVGFGGPFLEDFKILHALFGHTRMVSLEMVEQVYQRQLFNAPCTGIELLNTTSGNFINGYTPDSATIAWLDFVAPKEIRPQLGEFQSLLSKLQEFDVVKITLNANPSALGPKVDDPDEEKRQRWSNLRKRIGEFLPPDDWSERMTHERYPSVLGYAVTVAADSVLASSKLKFFPLSAFSYKDGAQMFTATGMLATKEGFAGFTSSVGLSKWEFSTSEFCRPRKIDLPDLSFRERMHIEQRLPAAGIRQVYRALNFDFENSRRETLVKLAQYRLFYRHFPFFAKIVG